MGLPRPWLLAVFICWQTEFCVSGSADETRQSEPQAIGLDDLPAAPAEFQRWIETGDLKFSFGGKEPSVGGMAAETTYRMVHRYRSNPRWTIRKNGTTRTCQIRLRFRSVKLETTHEIWFLKKPDSETFWTNRLVLHEFDHLRLSADPRHAKRFDELMHKETVIERIVKSGASVNGRWVQDQVDQYVQEQFAKVSDLAAIRYQELDRLTSHGRRKIPDDSEIAKTLSELKR